MNHEMQQTETKVALQAWHYESVEQRYQGKTYKQISEIIWTKYGKRMREDRIRRWFMRGGILHDNYETHANRENEMRQSDIRQRLTALAESIPDVLQDTLFQPLRNPFTGQIIKDESGNILYIRNKTTNEAVKILATMLGAKFDESENNKVGDVLDRYFDRVEKMGKPEETPAVPAA
jgi:pyruvate/oxaloacetate carboxyltransferase